MQKPEEDSTGMIPVRHYEIHVDHYEVSVAVPKGLTASDLEERLTCKMDHLEYYDKELDVNEDIELDIVHMDMETDCTLLELFVDEEGAEYNTAAVACTASGVFACVHDGDFDADKHAVDQCFDIFVDGQYVDKTQFDSNCYVGVVEVQPPVKTTKPAA